MSMEHLYRDWAYLAHVHVKALQSRTEVDFADRLFLGFGKGEMAEEDGCVESKRVHIF